VTDIEERSGGAEGDRGTTEGAASLRPETTTQPPAEGGPPLPPDPAEYDSERNALARARGLTAPYIAGGRDPEPEEGLREERRLLRLLLLMVGVIIAGGFVLGIIANLMAARGGG
jgi:hypothetical protein